MTGEDLVTVGRGIELCYDSFGDAAAPPVLLIAGLRALMKGIGL